MELLQEILQAHTWACFGEDITPTIHLGRVSFDPETDPLPLITLVPALETSEPTRYNCNAITLSIGASALVSTQGGAGAFTVGETVLAELHHALFQRVNPSTLVAAAHNFADNAARDTYFTANPSEKTTGTVIRVGSAYQQWSGLLWISYQTHDQRLSDLADITYTGGGVAEYPDTPAGPAVITVGINFNLHYETITGDPYNVSPYP